MSSILGDYRRKPIHLLFLFILGKPDFLHHYVARMNIFRAEALKHAENSIRIKSVYKAKGTNCSGSPNKG